MKDRGLKMAKIVLLALPVLMFWMILRGSAGEVDFSLLREDVEQAVGLTGMKQGDARLLRRFYGLNGEELENWTLWTAEDNMAVEELLLAECDADFDLLFPPVFSRLFSSSDSDFEDEPDSEVLRFASGLSCEDFFLGISPLPAVFFFGADSVPAAFFFGVDSDDTDFFFAEASVSGVSFFTAASGAGETLFSASAAFFAAIFLARCLSRFHCFLQSRQTAYSLKTGSPVSLVPICFFCNSTSFPHIGHFIIMYSSLWHAQSLQHDYYSILNQ